MRSYSTCDVRRRACEEKEPAASLSTFPRQSLQIQHLPKRHSPQCQNVLVQMLALVAWPCFKCWRIPSHSGKIAVVQPILDTLFLAQAGVALTVLLAQLVLAECELAALFWRLGPILFCPSHAYEKHVADFDVATLALRTDVYALVLATLIQFFKANGIVVIGIVRYSLPRCVTSVVEQDTAASDAMLCPMVDAASFVGGRTGDVGAFSIVVKRLASHVGKMPEAVPLGARLSVHVIDIIISKVLSKGFDLVMKGLPAERGLGRVSER